MALVHLSMWSMQKFSKAAAFLSNILLQY